MFKLNDLKGLGMFEVYDNFLVVRDPSYSRGDNGDNNGYNACVFDINHFEYDGNRETRIAVQLGKRHSPKNFPCTIFETGEDHFDIYLHGTLSSDQVLSSIIQELREKEIKAMILSDPWDPCSVVGHSFPY